MPGKTPFAPACLGLFLNIFVAAWPVPYASAAGLLLNPGFEADPPGENQNVVGWQLYGANHFSESNNAVAHGGNNYFKVYQAFNGATNLTGAYQDYISGPGATYWADGWAYTDLNDTLTGQNVAWIEVTF